MTTEAESNSNADAPASSGQAPSNTRYVVLTFLCVLAFIFYVDRICISKALLEIEKDLRIDHTDMSWVLVAFTIAYSLFEVPMGWWGDKYGSRGVMTRIVVWWSAFTALTGAAFGLYSLITIRFLFGAGEAGAFPNTARILSRWFPANRRGMAQGLVNSMAQVGGAAAPVLTGYCMDWYGWRWTFVIFSTPGVVWAIVFWWWYRDDPAVHPGVNAAERELIAEGCPAAATSEHPPIPWRAVLRSLNVFLLGGILSCTAFNTYLYFSWYSTYLEQGRGLNSVGSRWLTSLVLVGGAVGCIGGGFVIDALLRRFSDRRRCRRYWGCLALSSAAVFLTIGVYRNSPTAASVWTALSVMMAVSTLASWWGAVTDVSGRHLGAMFGLMNSMGGCGAAVSQLFVGYFAEYQQRQGLTGRVQWDPMFFVYASVLIVGAVGWLFVDTMRPIERHDES